MPWGRRAREASGRASSSRRSSSRASTPLAMRGRKRVHATPAMCRLTVEPSHVRPMCCVSPAVLTVKEPTSTSGATDGRGDGRFVQSRRAETV
jgi:hypothetical protein